MNVFYLFAALLTAAALLFVLPPLLGPTGARRRAPAARSEANLAVLRDQLRELDADLAAGVIDAASHLDARRELLARVAADVPETGGGAATVAGSRWTALAVGLLVPLLAIGLYALLGTPAALDPAAVDGGAAQVSAEAGATPQGTPHEVSEAELATMTARLAARLQARPDDVDGWGMLARSYASQGKFSESAEAYRQAVERAPGDADMLASYADVLAMVQGKSMQGQPERLIERALALEPNNVKALSLSGSAAFERRDFAAAVAQWKKILLLVPNDSEVARDTMSSIGTAQGRMAGGQ